MLPNWIALEDGGYLNMNMVCSTGKPHGEPPNMKPAIDLLLVTGHIRHLVGNDALRAGAVLGIPLAKFLKMQRYKHRSRPVAVTRNGVS